jgi:anti-sigma factor RsiW
MNATSHLSADEIVARVFPEEGGPAAVPAHLAGCAACQERVARLREAWLLDRGAVGGYVDGLPEGFWTAQAGRTMAEIRSFAAPKTGVPGRTRFLRHPALAFASLAAALLLVATATISRVASQAPAVQSQSARAAVERPTPSTVDRSDDELLRAIDRALDDNSLANLVPEGTL